MVKKIMVWLFEDDVKFIDSLKRATQEARSDVVHRIIERVEAAKK